MRRSIQLATLRYAVVIGEECSLLCASQRLGIHHSALSRRIRDLEHALGITLFTRHPSGMRPTAAGAGFLRDLRRVLADLDTALAVIEGAVERETRSPAIDFDACLLGGELLHAVTDFIRTRPEIALRLEAKRATARLP